jgi:hypothetical protein
VQNAHAKYSTGGEFHMQNTGGEFHMQNTGGEFHMQNTGGEFHKHTIMLQDFMCQ